MKNSTKKSNLYKLAKVWHLIVGEDNRNQIEKLFRLKAGNKRIHIEWIDYEQ